MNIDAMITAAKERGRFQIETAAILAVADVELRSLRARAALGLITFKEHRIEIGAVAIRARTSYERLFAKEVVLRVVPGLLDQALMGIIPSPSRRVH